MNLDNTAKGIDGSKNQTESEVAAKYKNAIDYLNE